MANRVIVIGGGAAGLMAGLIARENGAEVKILERNDRIGRKLLATGNGRCNFTNINATIENYHGENKRFPYSAFSQFDVYSVLYFFESIGITPRIEEAGKVFPNSLQSSSMLDVFMYEIENRGIDLRLNSYVEKIYKMDDFKVETSDGSRYSADKIILATGGKSLPKSGSDGNGYKLAENFGHRITETFPGIVQLHTDDKNLKEKSGVRFEGIVSLYVDGEFIMSDRGDVLFTDYGISGPTVLQVSRRAIKALRDKKDVRLSVNLILDKNEDELFDYLKNRFQLLANKTLEESLIGYINKKLIRPILRDANLNKDKRVSELTNEEIRSLSRILAAWTFRVTGNQPWEFAQVTAGGIDTSDIENRTMESKLVDGLYIIGEALDVDGDCGGYNLQWAWSSAYVAGISAAID